MATLRNRDYSSIGEDRDIGTSGTSGGMSQEQAFRTASGTT